GDGLPQSFVVDQLVESRSLPDQLVVDPATGNRGGSEYLLRRRGQLFHPGQQQVSQTRRKLGTRRRRGEQFLCVVGVALGPGDHPVNGLGVELMQRQRGQVLCRR